MSIYRRYKIWGESKTADSLKNDFIVTFATSFLILFRNKLDAHNRRLTTRLVSFSPRRIPHCLGS